MARPRNTASSREHWYTIEVRLLTVNGVVVGPGAPQPVTLVASSDNPDRGGTLWVGSALKNGSLLMRAGRQGRTLQKRFEAEAEPHLPPLLRNGAAQWAIAIAFHAAVVTLAFAFIGDAARRQSS